MNKLLVNLMLCLTLAVPAAAMAGQADSDAGDTAGKQSQSLPADKAGIYIYRNSGWMGKAQTKSVWFDGQLLGGLPNESFFFLEIAPGEHTLSSQAEPGQNDLHFSVKAGKSYYFNQVFSRKVPVVGALIGAFVSVAKFEAVGDEDGQTNVLSCEQVQVKNFSVTGIVQPDCVSALESDPELKPISKKVALSGKEDNLFSLLSLDERPAKSERKVIAKWGSKRERCFNANPPPRDNYHQISVDAFNRGQKLILELSKGEMTYGQFAERRKEIKQTSLTEAQALQKD
ncbi:MAG: DUF2846 domain-containing protein [Nitrosomonadales bacterium]|nr:DUF2846 domain-containing protein [Nitrosomonadales bacterium]